MERRSKSVFIATLNSHMPTAERNLRLLKSAIDITLVSLIFKLQVANVAEALFKTQVSMDIYQFLAVNYFRKKAPSLMFDWVLNTPLCCSIAE